MTQSYTLNELASLVSGRVSGNGDTVITGLNGIDQAASGEITYITNRKMVALLAGCNASACVVPEEIEVCFQ